MMLHKNSKAFGICIVEETKFLKEFTEEHSIKFDRSDLLALRSAGVRYSPLGQSWLGSIDV